MQQYDITTREQLDEAVKEVLNIATRSDVVGAVVLALSGDLGAGKTTFVQGIASALGVFEPVTSPTFVVMKQYPTDNDRFRRLVHIDAYRIESIDEMRVLGFADILTKKDTIICIEWAEQIKELLPATAYQMVFDLGSDGRRTLTLTHNA